MDKIKVHVLNFHSIFSHIEIVLENTSVVPHLYYGINRWAVPDKCWTQGPNGVASYIAQASSTYSFEIDENPDKIIEKWQKYWNDTSKKASIVGHNCAVAAQWFLSEFAGISKPSLSNISFNHLAFGIVWPSFIPCPVTLPGRIMSNAKFHITAKHHPEIVYQYSKLFLHCSIALATLTFSASIFALAVASTVLTGGIAAAVITGCASIMALSTTGFFKATNLLSARKISSIEGHLSPNLVQTCHAFA